MPTGVTCVVPARLGSTRFFGKLLTPLLGKPLIVHTLERAREAGCFDRVLCLTDSEEIGAVVEEWGGEWALSGEAANGTERIARSLALPALRGAELVVNLQGDEPAFPVEGLRALATAITQEPDAVHLLVHDEEPSDADLGNPNRVKVAFQSCWAFAGFVRSVPDGARAEAYRLQLGGYAYSRAYLERYAALPPSAEEIALSHEMLRAPHLATLRAHPCRPGASVDVPEDLDAARAALEHHSATTARAPHGTSLKAGAAPHPIFPNDETTVRLQGAPA